MKKSVHYFVALSLTLSSGLARPAHAICWAEGVGIAVGSAGATGIALLSIALAGGLTQDRTGGVGPNEMLAATGGALIGVAALGALFGLLPVAMGEPDRRCREYRAEIIREQRENPTPRTDLENTYLRSITTSHEPWAEMTVSQCRGLGFDRNECRDQLIPSWNQDRATLTEVTQSFFLRFNEEVSQLPAMTLAQRRHLAQQFADYIDEEILPYVSTHTVRVLHAMGRGLIARYHSEHVTADRRTLEIPLGDSPVYVTPTGVGFHF